MDLLKDWGLVRLANKVVMLREKWKTQPPYLQEVHQDMKGTNIGLAKVWNRTRFRIKFADVTYDYPQRRM